MKLLAMKVVRFEAGEISVYGRGMVLVPAETILEFQESLESELGRQEAERIILRIGENLTGKSTKRYIDKRKDLRPIFKKVTTGDPSIEMGREIFKMSGLGDIQILEVTKDADKFVVGTKNSPLAKEHLRTRGKSRAPVCHFLTGIIRGVLKASKDAEYSAVETRCLAMGNSDECVFEFRKRNQSA
ncbi:MAG: 4-vinyl reductase [Candidatus Micrarchaeia archaeon]